jgi:NADH-quinone oxidoreductase subunit M
LTAIIIYFFENEYKNAKAFYALILFMSFAMGYLLSLRWFIVLIFWELALIPIYFIAMIWGNGDAESAKKQ